MMHDRNDNNVDDNLERLGALGFLAHLDSQKKLQDNQQKLQRTVDLERRSRENEERRRKNLPKCPWCGGGLEGEYLKCMYCASEISWVQGAPCRPGQEDAIRQEKLAIKEAIKEKEQAEQLRLNSEFAELKASANDLPRACPRCKQSLPYLEVGRSHKFYRELIVCFREHGVCISCQGKTEASSRKIREMVHGVFFVLYIASFTMVVPFFIVFFILCCILPDFLPNVMLNFM